MTNAKLKKALLPSRRLAHERVLNFGAWALFFAVVYCIILIKIVTFEGAARNIFFGCYSIAITSYIFSRFLFSYFHASVPADELYEPSVTFVVPAKNEEEHIAETIRCFARVDYPKNKMEAIVVNDGSTDRTREEMERARDELAPVLPVRVVHWIVNRGKRAGMAEGVRRARNDIIIFVDSDSFIEKDCVRHLVKYFADPRVGAVSGHSDVYNKEKNLLTRMQAVRYYISFKIYKGAESIFGSVTCCPGCCSAYRKAYVEEFLDEWLHQKFLGTECTFGDDRSLTNFIIRNYKAVYSPEAKARTVVPDTFRKYMKQQERWKKSWIRESFIAATFMWKKNPLAALSFYACMLLTFLAPVVFVRAAMWHPYLTHGWPMVYLAGLFLMLLLHGLYYRAEAGERSWFLAVVSFWFTAILLVWQLPWALANLNDSRWGTR